MQINRLPDIRSNTKKNTTRLVIPSEYSWYRYTPWDVVQLYFTEHKGYPSSEWNSLVSDSLPRNRLVSNSFKQKSSGFWLFTYRSELEYPLYLVGESNRTTFQAEFLYYE